MRPYHLLFIAIMAALVSCGHSDKPGKQSTLVVSIDPQRKILEELAGGNFAVVALLGKGADPETYEPTAAQRMASADAVAYFPIGYLPFENIIEQGLGADAKVFNTSEGITTLHGTHGHDGHSHEGDADPHVWTSLRNGKIIAANMLAGLIEIDPDNAAEYQSRYDALAQRLDSLDLAVGKQIADSHAHAFAVWHPSLSYYARDYGLHQLAVGHESKEMSIGAMGSVINEARADSVKVFFFQKEFDSRQAKSINDEIGSRLFTINPLAYDWEQEIINITNELTR